MDNLDLPDAPRPEHPLVAVLRAKLTAEEFTQLSAAIDQAKAAARAEGALRNGWQAYFEGCLRSVTQWFNGLLVLLPGLWALFEKPISDLVQGDIPPKYVAIGMAVIGAVGWVIRSGTTQSLEAKGINK